MMTLSEFMATKMPGQAQGEVARRIGISRSYLAEILSGAKKPGRETIAKIEVATDGAVPAAVWFAAPLPRDTAA